MSKTRKYFLMFVSFVLIFTHQQRNFVNQRHELQVALAELSQESPAFKEKYDYVKAKKPLLTVLPPNLTWLYSLMPPKITHYLPFKPLEIEGKAVTRFTENSITFSEFSKLPMGWDVEIIVDLNKIDSKVGIKAAIAHEIYHAWDILQSNDIKGHLALKTQENSLPYETRPSEIAAKVFEDSVVAELPSAVPPKKLINDDSEASEESIELDQ